MAFKVPIDPASHALVDLDAPVLTARETQLADGRRYWGVWCTECNAWHWHRPGAGHRRAHCHWSQSRFKATGYNLAPAESSSATTPADAPPISPTRQ